MSDGKLFGTLGGAAAGAVAGAAVALLLVPRGVPPSPRPPLTPVAESAESSPEPTRDNGSALEPRVRQLELELNAYKKLAALAAGMRDPNLPDAGTRARDNGGFVDAEDPVFRESVQKVMTDAMNQRVQQWKQTRLAGATRQAEDLAGKLGLDEAQKTRIAEIMRQYVEKRFEQRNEPSDAGAGAPQDRRAQGRQMQSAQRKEIEGVLNDGQKQKYQEMNSQQDSRRGGRR